MILSNRELLNPVALHGIADAGRFGNVYGAPRCDFDLRLDDVFVPIALARGNVAGKCEPCERRHRDVVRSAYPCFQHSSAPYRDGMSLADLLDPARFAMPAHSSKFDIDDPAGVQLNGG